VKSKRAPEWEKGKTPWGEKEKTYEAADK